VNMAQDRAGTLVIAHRGARSVAPENTITAARIAFEAGADLWETDVNITYDSCPVLFHDETLLRCSDACSVFAGRSSYRVADFTLKEIQALDAGSYYGRTDPFSQIVKGNVDADTLASFAGEFIPTLEHGLLFTQKAGWKINLELKYFPGNSRCSLIPDKTLDAVRNTKIDHERVVISSFHHDWLFYIRKKCPGIEIQALVQDNDINSFDFINNEFDACSVNVDAVDADMVRNLKSEGARINLFTINDPEIFSCFADMGTDGIFTDFPQVFSGFRKDTDKMI